MHPLRLRALLAGLLLCLLAGAPAAIATPADAEVTLQRAAERFRAKDFDTAAKLFMQAYAKTHRPDAVFNAARAYETAGKSGDAAGLFRLYISLTDDADGILEARQHLAKLAPKEPAVAPQIHAPASVAQPLTSPSTTVAVAPPQPSRLPAILTSGCAFVAVAGGVALLLVGKANSRQANADLRRSGDTQAYNAGYGRAQAEWWSGAILTGAGAVLGGVSIYMWNNSVAVQPTRQGIAVTGSF